MKSTFIYLLSSIIFLTACNNASDTTTVEEKKVDSKVTQVKQAEKPGTKKVFENLALGTELPAADIKMEDISGKSYALADLKKDNGLLVVFSCNTCPFVLDWEDRYPTVAEYCQASNIGFVVVNPNEAKRSGDDSLEAMKKHAEEKSYNFPYVVDKNHQIADAFGATRTPELFLFDKDGKLSYKGALDDSQKDAEKVENFYIKNAVDKMMAGEPIDPSITKSIGCTIKRLKS